MPLKKPVRVAGVDGCRGGWMVVSFHIQEGTIVKYDWAFCRHFRDVVKFTEAMEQVAVDMPIGLLTSPEFGGRLCDREARRLLGRRSSTIFTPPIRAWLNVTDYHKVRAKGVSRQAFGIFKKIHEVDRIMTPSLQGRIVEAHPELALGSFNGTIPQHSKKTPEGFRERISHLSGFGHQAFQRIRSTIDDIRKSCSKALVGRDDILDAMILALTAGRIRDRQAHCLPEKPMLDEKGLRMEIWF